MSEININRTSIRITADNKKVLIRPLLFGLDPDRIHPVVNFVFNMKENEVQNEITRLTRMFEDRHFNFWGQCMEHYQRLAHLIERDLTKDQKKLLGAFFSHEYSVQASALFNPSIVVLDNKESKEGGYSKFLLSLRATGEGHISSIAFLTGVIDESGEITMDESERIIAEGSILSLQELPSAYIHHLYPDAFDSSVKGNIKLEDALIIAENRNINSAAIKELFDNCYKVTFQSDIPMSSRVLFPYSRAESNGMEDVRFVKLEEEGLYVGTYTAYNGRAIQSQIILTNDFLDFEIYPLMGKAIEGKGLALFPRKINGKYFMIGRQDGRNLFIMDSDDLLIWENKQLLQQPGFSWDHLQLGNNGSPVETEEGWLVLTHAVGPMRRYTLSATLLDLNDPSKVIGVLNQPLMEPNDEEREGYVPNVLYTCGMMRHKDEIIIPYAMSDSAISFAKVNLNELLNALKLKNG